MGMIHVCSSAEFHACACKFCASACVKSRNMCMSTNRFGTREVQQHFSVFIFMAFYWQKSMLSPILAGIILRPCSWYTLPMQQDWNQYSDGWLARNLRTGGSCLSVSGFQAGWCTSWFTPAHINPGPAKWGGLWLIAIQGEESSNKKPDLFVLLCIPYYLY